MITSLPDSHAPRIFSKDTLLKGQPAQIECVEIFGQIYTLTRGPVTVLALEDEWYEDVGDPAAVVDYLQSQPGIRPDLFTFWQRPPDLAPQHIFHREFDSIAVLPVDTYQKWWTEIGKNTRNMVRKSQKLGVEVRECRYDDEFVRGMTDIFNETPVRQGRPFWHYGKTFETVKQQFSRLLQRERLLGAFYQQELIGFAMLGDAGRFCAIGQIIALTAHRDKAVPNALIAKAVQLCEQHRWSSLVYAYWSEGSLASFKRHSGFQEIKAPRYFVPLSLKGKLTLKVGAHRGWTAMLPGRVKTSLKRFRAAWYEHRGSE